MSRPLSFALALCLLAPLMALAAEPFVTVPLRIEPSQTLQAIVLRSGNEVRSVEVRDGKALVPSTLPFPWTVGSLKFEPTAYSEAELSSGRPLVLRELGSMKGILGRPSPRADERFTWLLQRTGSEGVIEKEVTVPADGAFQLALPAGTYHGAVVGASSGSRIRSGMVIKPGEETALGTIACEPAAPVTLRVLDAKRGGGVAGARVKWSPPGEKLNAGLSSALYARRWSGVTDRQGIATFSAIGPLPLSVRWSVEAKGFAPGQTAQLQVTEAKRFVLPDVALRPEAVIAVHVRFPAGDEEVFRGGVLGLGEPASPRDQRFVRKMRADLREAETKFTVGSYGRKRISIETAAGKTLLFHDLDVTMETTTLHLFPQRIDIKGRVTRKGEPVEKMVVAVADPVNGANILDRAPTDEDGEYRLKTFQSGELYFYTIGSGGRGTQSGGTSQRVDATGRNDLRVDFELPASGFAVTVVDAQSGAPLQHAHVRGRLRSAGNTVKGLWGEVDEQGRYVVADSAEGTAELGVSAKGYRMRELEIPIRADAPEMLVKLERSQPIVGRVVDAHGAPIRGARIKGGFKSELDVDPLLRAETDGNGRFQLDSPQDPKTLFYIAAPGHALGIATFSTERENVVSLAPPAPAVVTVRPSHAPPTKVYMVMAAPAGQSFVPLLALDDLADVNGMSPYQLNGTTPDGSLVLPSFLAPGKYDFYIARRGGKPFIYERVGSLTTPLSGNVALAYKAD